MWIILRYKSLFCKNNIYILLKLQKTLQRLSIYSIARSEEHTSELQSRPHLVCRLLLEKKNDLRLLCPYHHWLFGNFAVFAYLLAGDMIPSLTILSTDPVYDT